MVMLEDYNPPKLDRYETAFLFLVKGHYREEPGEFFDKLDTLHRNRNCVPDELTYIWESDRYSQWCFGWIFDLYIKLIPTQPSPKYYTDKSTIISMLADINPESNHMYYDMEGLTFWQRVIKVVSVYLSNFQVKEHDYKDDYYPLFEMTTEEPKELIHLIGVKET